ncbi:MAG TPA: hypothetical protein VKF32_04725 [Thermoanaerobaculia bacterium]|nr:hypothetical protein [Thermoanaerobaculia bacterium]
MRRFLPIAAACLLFALSPLAAAQAPKPDADEGVEKGMKGRVFDVKHRDPTTLRSILRTLGSGAKGAVVDVSSELKTIAVRDFPENLATMEDALKRLDRAGPPQADVELRMHVLLASRAAGGDHDVPPELKDALGALRSTLTYKGYRLLSTFTQRVTDGTRGVHGGGVATFDDEGHHPLQMEFGITQVAVLDASGGPASVRLDGFKFALVGDGRSEMATEISVKEGEQVVVGTSTFKDRGLILVVSAKVMR